MRPQKQIEHDLQLAEADVEEKKSALLNFADMSSAYDRASALEDLNYLFGRVGELTQELRDLKDFEKAQTAPSAPNAQKVVQALSESMNDRIKSMTNVDDFEQFGVLFISKSEKENTFWAIYNFKDQNQDFNEMMDKLKESQDKFTKRD